MSMSQIAPPARAEPEVIDLLDSESEEEVREVAVTVCCWSEPRSAYSATSAPLTAGTGPGFPLLFPQQDLNRANSGGSAGPSAPSQRQQQQQQHKRGSAAAAASRPQQQRRQRESEDVVDLTGPVPDLGDVQIVSATAPKRPRMQALSPAKAALLRTLAQAAAAQRGATAPAPEPPGPKCGICMEEMGGEGRAMAAG